MVLEFVCNVRPCPNEIVIRVQAKWNSVTIPLARVSQSLLPGFSTAMLHFRRHRCVATRGKLPTAPTDPAQRAVSLARVAL